MEETEPEEGCNRFLFAHTNAQKMAADRNRNRDIVHLEPQPHPPTNPMLNCCLLALWAVDHGTIMGLT